MRSSQPATVLDVLSTSNELAELGKTPTEYVQELQIERAVHLLRTTSGHEVVAARQIIGCR